ncbi:hypothetical protein [Gordonia sp. 'Campus']|uniref:hypothetical protein n=1 Tax=Gordonia sp. 'Campus' TaxID=2915824 RepID=UPI001EE3D773|nr:hypothetical protein [Gordonia sp. 'Campus']
MSKRVPASMVPVGALAVLLTALLVGGAVYLALPTGTADAEDTRPPAEQIDAASDSVSSAKMMFQLMSAGLNSATGGIATATASARDVFDAVDTAASASDQLVRGLGNAPNVSSATRQVNDGALAVSSVLGQVSSLSNSVTQLDSLVTPLIGYLETARTPGSADALERLRALQGSSREIGEQLGSLDSLQGELATMRKSLDSSASGIDSAITQAQTAAGQLSTGLNRLASARADTVSATDKVNAGVKQLQGVLNSINDDLDNASTNLTPATSDAAAPPASNESVGSVAERVSSAVVVGSGVGAILLALLLIRVARARHDGPDDGALGNEADDAELVGASAGADR